MERGALNTASSPVDVVSTSASALGESPLWHPGLRCLLWVDIVGKRLHRLDPASGDESHWTLPEEPGCIGLVAAAADGPGRATPSDEEPAARPDRLVIALRSGFHQLDWRDDSASGIVLRRLTPPLFDTARYRFNDGKVDPSGRFWAGTLFEPKTVADAGLYCLERGVARPVTGAGTADSPGREWGVTTSNGLAFSPDGRLMYHSDTPAHVVYVHDIDPVSGRPLNRRVWWRTPDDKTAPDYAGRPDGAAVDVAGCYWTALFEGGRIAQISPSGELLQTVVVPARCPTMVAFGGPDRRTLYVTSARHGRSDVELDRWPLSGRVFALRVPVAGLPPNLYRP